MPKIMAIGHRADILPFKAAGVELLEVETSEDAAAAFDSIMGISEPCAVMVTEDLMEAVEEPMAAFRVEKARAVLVIPSMTAAPGARLASIRALVARALGVDLLGRAKEEQT